ncbi:MAG TPA: alpha/beta hydrolase [Fontimonas sp.]
MRHEYASINSIRLHYVRGGTGPLMLFLHGFPEAWFTWENQLQAFAASHTVVAPDLRGYNLSDKPTEVADYRPSVLVEDIRQLIAHLGFERCVLVAHDWGGAVAWNFAAAHRQRVDRLVILNAPHPVLFARELRDNPAQQAASQYMRLLCSDAAEQAMSEDGYARLAALFGERKQDDATLARYRAAWDQPGALTGMFNYYRASPLRPPAPDGSGPVAPDLDPRRFMIHVPTMVIWGEADIALLPGILDGLDALVPDLRIERLPRATHWVAHDEPQAVNALIHEFVR